MGIFKLFKNSKKTKEGADSDNEQRTADPKDTQKQKNNALKGKPAPEKTPMPDQDVSGSGSGPDTSASVLSRFKKGLKKTSAQFGKSFADLLLGKKIIDEDLIDDIEMQLLTADIGIEATEKVMEAVRDRVSRNEIQKMDQLKALIQAKLNEIIEPVAKPLEIDETQKPYVILMVGVNGTGKTTTIGKLAKKIQAENRSVMLAAGDTFRAGAVEQLQIWGRRNQVPVVAQHKGADSASVVYDAINSARSQAKDVVIADTAGRLHTQSNLMAELKKIVRVMKKLDSNAPHEVMLVLDATLGQNALTQAEKFTSAVNVSGLTITKMDGTAKGGVIFAIAQTLGIPIRFVGVGESVEDLKPFEAQAFTEAIFSEN